MRWFTTSDIEKIRKLRIELAGKMAEKEALLYLMRSFKETCLSHMDDYIKVESRIAKIKKEIELLEGSC